MPKVEFFYNKVLEFEQIAATYQKAYHRELDIAYWNWRFLNNPYDSKILISYIIENNELAAYYAASPCYLLINNTKYKFVLVNMAMTHPDYLGKGYLKMVAGELFQNLSSEGYIGALGFANANSHYGHRKYLGWIDLSVLNSFSTEWQSFRADPASKDHIYSFKSSKLDEVSVHQTESMICCRQGVHIERDIKFLNWRLISNPIHNYYYLKLYHNDKLVGIILYKFFKGNIDIIEFFFNPDKEPEKRKMLNIGISELLKKSKASVQIWSNLHSDEHLMLEKSGFKETHFITYMGVIPFKNVPEIQDLKNWHFRYIDSDVF
jgi:hypothetical protein